MYAGCDKDHARNYFVHYIDPKRLKELVNADPEDIPFAACIHCRWCGFLVNVPADCLLHGAQCPDWSWELSEQCYGFAVRYLQRTGAEYIMGAVLQQAEEVSLLNPNLGGPGVAEVIIHRKDSGFNQ
jgi:hypothetical protein